MEQRLASQDGLCKGPEGDKKKVVQEPFLRTCLSRSGSILSPHPNPVTFTPPLFSQLKVTF